MEISNLKRAFVLPAIILAGCAGKGVKTEESKVPLVGSYQVTRFVLDNGLKILIVEDHHSPTFAYQTWYQVGSRNEVTGHTGLAHLFEHMMFKGTKLNPEGQYEKILEQAGARGVNAFTSRDFTAYIQELPKEKLNLVASLESDRMTGLTINEKSYHTEIDVVQNERRFRDENSPEGLMDQEEYNLAFTVHPYHWPVIGYSEDLDRMKVDDALHFYHTFYSPNHATVIVSGDVKPDQVLSTLKKHYGQIPAQPSPIQEIKQEPPQESARHKMIKLNIKVQKLVMGYRTPSATDPEMATLDVIEAILAGGKSSRLNRALVNTGLASSVNVYASDDKDPSLFSIWVNMQKGRKTAQAETVILRELARLAKEPVPDQELQRAKNRISYDFYSGLDTNYEKARFLGTFETITGNFENGIARYNRAMTVTPAQIQNAVKIYFDRKNRTVITGIPK